LVILTGIILLNYFNQSSLETKKLASIEIRDYNSSRLDSFNDFRENSIKGIQYINISNYNLKISGLVENEKSYSYNEVLSHQSYEKVVTLNCVEGWSATILWKGILIKDLFDEAKSLPSAKTIIFHAYDGYTVTYPVDYFNGKNILLAYNMNNITIPPERGYPFVLVAEDKWGYKWIKWITEIEFSDDVNYKGYWESRGYSKEGNLNESFLS
jgi:DMSO/TMAO reductase YedYZ molybdopterin-dependent catalytic subunit